MRKLVIIGLGLIGGSLAAALKKVGDSREIIAVVRRPRTAEIALKKGFINRAVFDYQDIAAELGEGDIVFIAVPTLSVPNIIQNIAQCTASAVTITDGASVKGSIYNAVKAHYVQVPPQFVLGHPIAGSEKSGVEASNADLYRNHRVILTPSPDFLSDQGVDSSHLQHIKYVKQLWEKVGLKF